MNLGIVRIFRIALGPTSKSSPDTSGASIATGHARSRSCSRIWNHCAKPNRKLKRRRLNPAITLKWLQEHTPNLPVSFDGLRKVGLPEE